MSNQKFERKFFIIKNHFNAQECFDKLQEVESCIVAAMMVCEGLSYANGAILDDQFRTVSTGAFRLMATALGKTYETLDHELSAFHNAHGVKFPYEMKGETA